MKRLLLFLLGAAAFLAPVQSTRAEVSFGVFYSSLGDYGEWWEHPDYGYCWRPSPTLIESGWRPYSDGYWAYTDGGWTWVSYEDWGWATYHYGRWTNLPGYGWAWVPGYEWAPAWVSWRSDDDYIGWAPLPPRARWNWDIGFSIWVDRDCDIGPGYYNFCQTRYFGAPWVRRHIMPVEQNITIIQKTVNITNITVYNNSVNQKMIYNGGPDYAKVNAKSEQKVPKLKLARVENPDDLVGKTGKDRLAKAKGDTLEVVSPTIVPSDKKESPKAARKMTNVQPEDTGWAVVADPDQRKQIRKKVADQTGNVASNQPAAGVPDSVVKGFVPDGKRDKSKVVSNPGEISGKPEKADKTSKTTGRETADSLPGTFVPDKQRDKGVAETGPASTAKPKGLEKAERKTDVADPAATARQLEAERIKRDGELRKKAQDDALRANRQQQQQQQQQRAMEQSQQEEKFRKMKEQQQQAEALRRQQADLQESRKREYDAINQKEQARRYQEQLRQQQQQEQLKAREESRGKAAKGQEGVVQQSKSNTYPSQGSGSSRGVKHPQQQQPQPEVYGTPSPYEDPSGGKPWKGDKRR